MTDEIASIDPANLRVSNAERERAGSLLQDALDQGMITIDEFGERSAIAASAKVRGELTAILADLPAAVQNGTVALTSRAAVDTERPLELNAGMGNVNQVGEWTVPARINARCSMGNVKIDFSEAICRHRDVWLHAECGWGNIKVLVPHGWTVVVESVSVGSGRLTNKITSPGDPHLPVLHVEGSVSAGDIKIRYAD
ncbi:DUF1707 domain-containing protein [Kutzneria buriramensis]|uniref:Cell wall-active antibiotic response 4TMS protein YvqF n=1 Tax=Kutzneria buriramensis TaxID=1045776 RepID=A0A3E0HV21_9PSEU|nr:DUF1707 domain-containing protein [Kutzneria buriramensis]REH50269.1 cell wall-active antibiotic response 4TMS protein YvqF [Kutzneria buriramensis]